MRVYPNFSLFYLRDQLTQIRTYQFMEFWDYQGRYCWEYHEKFEEACNHLYQYDQIQDSTKIKKE